MFVQALGKIDPKQVQSYTKPVRWQKDIKKAPLKAMLIWL